MQSRAGLVSMMFAVLISTAGCREDDWKPIVSVPSPDSSLRAHAVRYSGGGATVGTGYGIVIASDATPLDYRTELSFAWRSYGVPIKYVFWRSDDTLEVVVSNEDRYDFESIRLSPPSSISIITTVMVGSRKEDVLDARQLEVPVSSE
ncbi:MAG: hypothetical protein KBI44_18525 [Thermoanaerobaculia bacterium]|nr:hypothetical protein [Thermoanaerobaculia bacterium]